MASLPIDGPGPPEAEELGDRGTWTSEGPCFQKCHVGGNMRGWERNSEVRNLGEKDVPRTRSHSFSLRTAGGPPQSRSVLWKQISSHRNRGWFRPHFWYCFCCSLGPTRQEKPYGTFNRRNLDHSNTSEDLLQTHHYWAQNNEEYLLNWLYTYFQRRTVRR